MNIFLASKWNQHPYFQKWTRNQHFELIRPEIGVLSLRAAWEINIFLASKWNQHSCCPALTRNQQFKLLKPEIDLLELTPCEIDMLLVSKWNEHPCRHVLMWNQQFLHFRLEINKIELTCCVKWTFHCSLSENWVHFTQHVSSIWKAACKNVPWISRKKRTRPKQLQTSHANLFY